MDNSAWHIYLAEIPSGREGVYWVSFESDRALKKTKSNIYGRCLPCIQNLYEHLRDGKGEIALGTAFHCWKVTAIIGGLDQALELLGEFEARFPDGHVYGKLGNGRPGALTNAVVFHTDSEIERDRLEAALNSCLESIAVSLPAQVSRACAVLYDDILGDWREWQPVMTIKHPEKAAALLERIRNMLYRSAMS